MPISEQICQHLIQHAEEIEVHGEKHRLVTGNFLTCPGQNTNGCDLLANTNQC